MSLITGFLLWIFLERKPLILIFIFVVLISSFIYFAPLSYGLPMSDVEYNARVWLPSWR
jgi:dolichyl-phosphate-mannose--protein O-mannosyl transferase